MKKVISTVRKCIFNKQDDVDFRRPRTKEFNKSGRGIQSRQYILSAPINLITYFLPHWSPVVSL